MRTVNPHVRKVLVCCCLGYCYSLGAACVFAQSVSASKGTDVPIPDGSCTGNACANPASGCCGFLAQSCIDISNAPPTAVITSIDVGFQCVHSYSADLAVYLSDVAILWDHEGGPADNPSDQVSGITAANGLLVNQQWCLLAEDCCHLDSGRIDSWNITIHYTVEGCSDDSDCDDCEKCQGDDCVPVTCPTGQRCDDDHGCESIPNFCSSNSACGPCETCQNNTCVPFTCPMGQQCNNHACQSIPNYCSSNSGCGACQSCQNNVCTTLSCPTGQQCNNNHSCESIPDFCSSSAGCASCQTCQNNVCVALSCPIGQQCDGNHGCASIPGFCSNNSYCGPCQTCQNNVCMAISCTVGQRCNNNHACESDPGFCSNNSQCGPCQTCQNNACVTLTCPIGQQCNSNHACSTINGFCSSHTQCGSCEQCQDNRCVPLSCPAGEECDNNHECQQEEATDCNPSGTRLSALTVAEYAYDAGFRDDDLETAIAIARAESDFRIGAWCQNCLGVVEDSRGLWQINILAHPSFASTPEEGCSLLNSPAANAQAAFALFQTPNSWLHWSAYLNESYLEYQDEAQDAVEQLLGTEIRTVLAPVIGGYRVTGVENPACVGQRGLWTFCQHQTDLHREHGGISNSDDTFAYDINLVSDADAGELVYPIRPGKVVKYAGNHRPGAVSGAVLVEHDTAGEKWWSGYLHMNPIFVGDGELVGEDTPIGRISNVCQCGIIPNHLHLVVYSGSNTAGGLVSESVQFVERQTGGAAPCQSDSECNDEDSCTTDRCEEGICQNNALSCLEGQHCSGNRCEPDGDVAVDPPVDQGVPTMTMCGAMGAINLGVMSLLLGLVPLRKR